MTEISAARQQFILHWGEMGARWGINRTVAQVHALLHVSEEALTAEQISAALSVARSNVSTSLRELQAWGLVRPVYLLGERRQHFTSVKEVWEMFRIILDQRKRREIDPTMELLRLCLEEMNKPGGKDEYARQRLREMYEFFADVNALYADIRELPLPLLRSAVKARGRVRRLLERKAERRK